MCVLASSCQNGVCIDVQIGIVVVLLALVRWRYLHRLARRLQASESQLRAITDSIPAFIIVLRADGTIEYANSYFEELSGFCLAELRGMDWFEVFFPVRDREIARQRFLSKWTEQIDSCSAYTIMTREGQVRDVELRNRFRLNSKGTVTDLLIVGIDVTQRRTVEQVLRKSEAQLNGFFRAAEIGMAIFDRDGRLLRINDFLATASGHFPKACLGRRPHEVLSPELARVISPALGHVVHTRERVLVHIVFQGGRHGEAICFPLLGPDRALAEIGVVVYEVKAIEEAEAAARRVTAILRTVVAGAPIVIITLDREGVITFSDGLALDRFGYHSSDMVGQLASTFFADVEGASEAIRRALSGEQTVLRSALGSARFEMLYAPSFDDRGMVTGVIGVAFDVTEKCAAELALRDTKDELERRVEELVTVNTALKSETEQRKRLETELNDYHRLASMSIMAGSIAHELSQPLTAIVNYAKGGVRHMSSVQEAGDMTQILYAVTEEAHRAGRIIHSLRDLIRRRPLQLELGTVHESVTQALFIIDPIARTMKVRILRKLADDLPLIPLDKLLITQAILNLLTNAFEAMEHTPLERRELTVEVLHNKSDEVLVGIHDRGVGLPPDKELFVPFHTTKHGGTGLGLIVARNLIELHDGRIWAHPRDGGGASFFFTLSAKSGSHAHDPTDRVRR